MERRGDSMKALCICFLVILATFKSESSVSSEDECILKVLNLSDRYYVNAIKALPDWKEYKDLEKIKRYLKSEISYIEQCQSQYPSVVMTEDGMLFVRSNLESVKGYLRFSLIDFESIPKLKFYPEKKRLKAVGWFSEQYESTRHQLDELLKELNRMKTGWKNTPGYDGGRER